MAFEKGNQLGRKSKRGLGKKTVIKNAFTALQDINLNPIKITGELINGILLKQEDLSFNEKIELIKVISPLHMFQLMTPFQMIQALEPTEKQVPEPVAGNIIAENPEDLLKQLQEK